MIRITIPGEPVAKARPRVTKWGTYTPDKTKNYETLVKELFFIEHGQILLDGPLDVEIKAFFKIPKSTSKKKRYEMVQGILRPIKKPDVDNVIKSITDALNDLAYLDDKQIVKVTTEKLYSEEPRVEVEIRNWEVMK
jgi:Holliday junction resolvase RusA-like endonuclease